MTRRFVHISGVVVLAALAAGCGKKGPPLAPLRIAPAAVTSMEARRVGDRVTIRFTLPERNDDNSTPADVARVEVYALSAPQATDAPQGPEFLRVATRVGTVTAKPGETAASIGETLDASALQYYEPKRPPASATPPAAPAEPAAPATEGAPSTPAAPQTAAPGAPAAATSPAGRSAQAAAGVVTPPAPVPVRVYMAVPVSAKGRRGVGATTAVPLAEPPPQPGPPVATHDEKTIKLAWVAPEGESRSFNVYEVSQEQAQASDGAVGLAPSPLNPAPLAEPAFEDPRVAFGTARCYRLTTVATAGTLKVESSPSPAACVTPVDTFAPPAPTGVSAVAGSGTISLIWDAVAVSDLAGYLVLRGDAAGGTLQTLTPEPISETTFRDAAVQPGVRYVYVVVAVDTAKNMSAQSERVEETAR